MKKTVYIIIGIVFLILVSGFSYYLGAKKAEEKSMENSADRYYFPFYSLDEIEKNIIKQIEKENRVMDEFFDDIFNDKFFSKDYDPFYEIERFHRKMFEMLDKNHRSIFDRSFNDWFNKRISLNNVKVKEYEDDKHYIFEISVDKNKNYSVEVKNNYIKIYSNAENIKKEENKNSVYQSRVREQFVKYISIPKELAGKEYTVDLKEGKIIVKFIK